MEVPKRDKKPQGVPTRKVFTHTATGDAKHPASWLEIQNPGSQGWLPGGALLPPGVCSDIHVALATVFGFPGIGGVPPPLCVYQLRLSLSGQSLYLQRLHPKLRCWTKANWPRTQQERRARSSWPSPQLWPPIDGCRGRSTHSQKVPASRKPGVSGSLHHALQRESLRSAVPGNTTASVGIG